MSIRRVVLALSAAFVVLSGVACILAPASFAQQAGLSVTPGALTEVRAFYGGLQVGIGCFLFWCLRGEEATFAGLVLVAVAVGGAGLARTFGILVDREPTAFHLTNLAIEAITVAVVAIALSTHRRVAQTHRQPDAS